jgi:hypothetical protein
MRCDERFDLIKSGDVLTVNGEAFDFGPLPEGATLPREAVTCDWLVSDVERIDGVIHLTLLLPHGPDAASEARFPVSILAADGPIPHPAPLEEIL